MANKRKNLVENYVYLNILSVIRRGGANSQIELAKLTDKKQSVITRQLEYLSKKGLIEIDKQTRQYNKKPVRITMKGEILIHDGLKYAELINEITILKEKWEEDSL